MKTTGNKVDNKQAKQRLKYKKQKQLKIRNTTNLPLTSGANKIKENKNTALYFSLVQ